MDAPQTSPDPLAELRASLDYDEEGDSSVDALIDYKNALEDLAYATEEARRTITSERDHFEQRYGRERDLLDAGRRDRPEEAEYADGVRYGLDLALLILNGDVATSVLLHK